ncbi:MAG: PaREP1/PaREP8 domain-contain protein [Thermoprotei archaeon]|nr:MAG: PaREP1/PaREP8 domain-contain protein [Thermoprotei archaeon]RLF23608.1 MAG: PaREP1/PaREP8 domain-contain protein [Thermoprotei archaeon]
MKYVSITLRIPSSLHEVLKLEAKRSEKTLEEYVLDLILRSLNAETSIKVYQELYERYLEEAKKYFEKGELSQAGEKYWGATTALLNIVALRRGWRHYSHRDYSDIVERIAEELKNPVISKLFAIAERLHANYYHSFIRSKELFDDYRREVIRLCKLLEEYIKSITSRS